MGPAFISRRSRRSDTPCATSVKSAWESTHAGSTFEYARRAAPPFVVTISPNPDATGYARARGHPVIASGEPGERWLYCYPGNAFAEYSGGRRGSRDGETLKRSDVGNHAPWKRLATLRVGGVDSVRAFRSPRHSASVRMGRGFRQRDSQVSMSPRRNDYEASLVMGTKSPRASEDRRCEIPFRDLSIACLLNTLCAL
jgi:hypothetical protein